MKIGLLMPARERLNLNLTLISSIITTVNDINNVVLYMGIDDDDPTKEIQHKIAAAIPFVKIIPIHNNKQFIGLGKIWNELARHSNEEIFGYIGNDMIFRTKDWDVKILEEFNKQNCPQDNIKLVHCHDGYRNGELCVNAFIHRKYYEVIGYFIREEFKINWSDQWLMQVFSAFDRTKYRPDILIEHNHWVFSKRNIDSTGIRMMQADKDINNQSVSDPLWYTLVNERIAEVKKLGQYLGKDPNWKVVDTKGAQI